MRNYLAKRRRARNCYLMITGPALSAIKLLEEWPNDPGLNLGTVRRNMEWCWSTYNYVGEHLSKRQVKTVEKLLCSLQDRIALYDWGAVNQADKGTDGWDDAMKFYNDHDTAWI